MIKALENEYIQKSLMEHPTDYKTQSDSNKKNIVKKSFDTKRRKRGAEEEPKRIKSLQQIIDEFKSTRDEIQSNFEWKYYNISEWEAAPTMQTTIPEIYNFSSTEVYESTTSPSIQCRCQFEIILSICSFGALLVIAYATVKLINYLKREK